VFREPAACSDRIHSAATVIIASLGVGRYMLRDGWSLKVLPPPMSKRCNRRLHVHSVNLMWKESRRQLDISVCVG
jgi:hypothetical protein